MNAFAQRDIYLPMKFQQALRTYSRTKKQGLTNRPEDSPFLRMVDMWFLAVCIAVKEGRDPVRDVEGKTYKAIEGKVFGRDDWRSDALMLIAVAHDEDASIVDDDKKMMNICNGLALAGLPRLVSILEGRSQDSSALDSLSDYILDLIEK